MSASPKTKSSASAGAKYLCLPPDPSFSDLANPGGTFISNVAGVVYGTVREPLEASHGDAVPCSVLLHQTSCPTDDPRQAVCPGVRWRMEYNGYLMSEIQRDTLSLVQIQTISVQSIYVCVSSETVGVEVL